MNQPSAFLPSRSNDSEAFVPKVGPDVYRVYDPQYRANVPQMRGVADLTVTPAGRVSIDKEARLALPTFTCADLIAPRLVGRSAVGDWFLDLRPTARNRISYKSSYATFRIGPVPAVLFNHPECTAARPSRYRLKSLRLVVVAEEAPGYYRLRPDYGPAPEVAPRREWTAVAEQHLKAVYQDYTDKELAAIFNTSARAIESKRHELSLTRNANPS